MEISHFAVDEKKVTQLLYYGLTSRLLKLSGAAGTALHEDYLANTISVKKPATSPSPCTR
jgi:hypothetical protein